MLRTWGRVTDEYGVKTWVEVTTDSNGLNDAVWLTTLIQNLKLNLGESPIYANNGIPAQRSIVTQILPDYYVAMVQQYFAPYFSSLSITRTQIYPSPIYDVNIITNQGAKISTQIAT
jgi:hypothetical protein